MKTHVIWLVVAIASLVIGTRFANVETRIVEKPVEVIKTKDVIIEKPVEVVREVPKEVERIVEKKVEVPAQIPAEYVTALQVVTKMRDAKILSSSRDALAGVRAVSVAIYLGEEVKKIVSESDIRTKFEITLRRSGVRIDENARHSLIYTQEGFTRDGGSTLVWSFSTELTEIAVGFRGDELFKTFVATWRKANYGTVGISKAPDSLVAEAERAAEAFANDWLAMNPPK